MVEALENIIFYSLYIPFLDEWVQTWHHYFLSSSHPIPSTLNESVEFALQQFKEGGESPLCDSPLIELVNKKSSISAVCKYFGWVHQALTP